MPKYNLLDHKDPDSLDQQSEKEIKKTDDSAVSGEDKNDLKIEQFEQTDSDSQFSEEIFDSAAISSMDNELDSAPPEIHISQEDDIHEPTPKPQDHKTPPFVKSDLKPLTLDSDYDEKQPGLNYKPIIYIAAAIAVVIAIYFGVTKIFFSGEVTDTQETVAETPEQRLLREQEERQNQFFTGISAENYSRLGQIVSLIGIRPSKITFSSILLYGDNLTFEVFARNRDDLATFNLTLKNNEQVTKHKIETVDTRPGKNGGLFAVYDIKMQTSPASSPIAASFTKYSPADWVNTVQFKIRSQRQIASRKENQYTTIRQEYIFTGSEQKFHELIKLLAASKANYLVHKLALVPANQTNMSNASYQMQLIIDFYL